MFCHFFDFSDKDVLTPPIREIDGMSFRVNPVLRNAMEEKSSKRSQNQEEEDVSALIADLSSDELDVLYNRLKKPKSGDTFRLVLDQESIPTMLFPMLIGRGGQAKKMIEDETKARILIPDKKEQAKDKPIEIVGYDELQLVICRRKLLQSAQNARMRVPFTHFLCFPLRNEGIVQLFGKFREEVISRCGSSRGFSEDLFQNPKKLHLTIGTLALFNTAEYSLAGDDVAECFMEGGFWKILTDGPLQCNIRGLEIMNDDPTEVDILYGIVDDPSGRIQKIANKLYKHFLRADPRFLQDRFEDRDGVKLHATLLNSRFRKGAELGEEDNDESNKSVKKFDASLILKHFKDFDFGMCTINEVHLSQRYSTALDGFFKATRTVKLDPAIFKDFSRGEDYAQEYGDEPACEIEEL